MLVGGRGGGMGQANVFELSPRLREHDGHEEVEEEVRHDGHVQDEEEPRLRVIRTLE